VVVLSGESHDDFGIFWLYPGREFVTVRSIACTDPLGGGITGLSALVPDDDIAELSVGVVVQGGVPVGNF